MDNFNKKIYTGKLRKVKIYEPPEPIERREHGMDDVQVNGTLLCNEKQKKLMNNMVYIILLKISIIWILLIVFNCCLKGKNF